MKRGFVAIAATVATVAIVLALGGCSGEEKATTGTPPAGGVVDLVYLNHGPVQPVLADIEEVLATYAGKVSVSRHDAGTAEGEDFAKDHGLTGHVALAVLIDGQVRFQGFPAGRSPVKEAEGNWTIEDLDRALRRQTSG
jgi:hypothetical protein